MFCSSSSLAEASPFKAAERWEQLYSGTFQDSFLRRGVASLISSDEMRGSRKVTTNPKVESLERDPGFSGRKANLAVTWVMAPLPPPELSGG